MHWGTAADWLVAFGTLALAVTTAFQDTIRSWLYHPTLRVRVRCEPPDCVMVPFSNGVMTTYLRIWVENVGNVAARDAEVYAHRLQRQRASGDWEEVNSFPPMNLKWANFGRIYFPVIAPGMGKHCDVAHITNPQERGDVPGEQNPALNLTNREVSMAFDLMTVPNHLGHLVRPGTYRLEIRVAAANARPIQRQLRITVPGPWYPEEGRMLRDGVGIQVLD